MNRLSALLIAFVLSGCASYDGRGLQPGISSMTEVEASMGPAAMAWEESDGTKVLAFPRGPAGYHTYLARFAADGRLRDVRNVLDTKTFACVSEGMTQEEVMHLIGPPVPTWTVYFSSRDELVWQWRFCDDWAEPARFNVFFAGENGKVTKTMATPERFSEPSFWRDRRIWCNR